MKLSMWTLCDYLVKEGFTVDAYISEGLPCISMLRESEKRSYTTGYAEVVSAGRDVHVVNYMDQLVVKSAHMRDVINSLSAAMDYYSQWEHDLYECALKRGTLQDMLDIAATVFDRPMFIKNDATRTLAITKGYPSSIHPFWDKLEKSMERGLPDYETVRAVSSDPDYMMAFMEKYPSIRSSPAYGAMVLHANIFVNDRRAAEIVALENNRPFNNGDIHLMNVFSEMISSYIQNNSRIFQSGVDTTRAMTSLVENGKIEKEQAQTILRYLGIEKGEEMCLIIATGEGQVDSPIISTLREKLESQMKDCAVVQMQGQIIVLTALKDRAYGEVVEDFKKIIPREGFRWGVSYEFRNIEELPEHHRQVQIIIDRAQFDRSNYTTMYEMASGLISDMCRKEVGCRALIHPDLRRLELADAEENTEYCKTLFYYLLCGGNFTDASTIMNVHRNTLIYRINKIRDIIKSSLDNIDNRELLLYSYLLQDRNPAHGRGVRAHDGRIAPVRRN